MQRMTIDISTVSDSQIDMHFNPHTRHSRLPPRNIS